MVQSIDVIVPISFNVMLSAGVEMVNNELRCDCRTS